MKLLNIDSTLSLKSLDYRGFVKLLTSTQFLYDTGFLKFSFEFLQGFFNVFAFFYGYYNHFFVFIIK